MEFAYIALAITATLLAIYAIPDVRAYINAKLGYTGPDLTVLIAKVQKLVGDLEIQAKAQMDAAAKKKAEADALTVQAAATKVAAAKAAVVVAHAKTLAPLVPKSTAKASSKS